MDLGLTTLVVSTAGGILWATYSVATNHPRIMQRMYEFGMGVLPLLAFATAGWIGGAYYTVDSFVILRHRYATAPVPEFLMGDFQQAGAADMHYGKLFTDLADEASIQPVEPLWILTALTYLILLLHIGRALVLWNTKDEPDSHPEREHADQAAHGGNPPSDPHAE